MSQIKAIRERVSAREKQETTQRLERITKLAFPDAVVAKAGQVLEELLDCDDAKERRLAAERIRDERGLTRVVKPTEHARVVVVLESYADPAVTKSIAVQAMHERTPLALPVVTVSKSASDKAK